jgi:hypothetical protein
VREELANLRAAHAKAMEDLKQVTDELTELRCSSRTEPVDLDAQVRKQDQEIHKLRSKLSQTRHERDQMKSNLKQCLEAQENDANAKEGHTEQDLQKLQAQLSSKDLELQKLREEREELRKREELWKQFQTKKAAEAAAKQLAQNLEHQLLQRSRKDEVFSGHRTTSKRHIVPPAVSEGANHFASLPIKPTLDDTLDMNTARLLGIGGYGLVMTCKTKASNEKVVLKFQTVNSASPYVKEWQCQEQIGRHPNIVELQEIFKYQDSDQIIRTGIASFEGDSGMRDVRAGPRFEWIAAPYVCLVSEFMDCGAISSFVDQRLITLEAVCAVSRQVACALGHIHQQKFIHGDVKPGNILLKRTSNSDILQVKLADTGLMEVSANHARDQQLLAAAIWFMVVGRYLPCSPMKRQAMTEFQKAPLLGRRATARGTALIDTVFGLWDAELNMTAVASAAGFASCEVRDQQAPEIRRQLAAAANLEVTKRADDAFKRFQSDIKLTAD